MIDTRRGFEFLLRHRGINPGAYHPRGDSYRDSHVNSLYRSWQAGQEYKTFDEYRDKELRDGLHIGSEIAQELRDYFNASQALIPQPTKDQA